MFKPIIAEDHVGQHWVSYEGDPSWPYVHALNGRGARYIVLPRIAFTTGTLGPFPGVPSSLAGVDTSVEALAAYLQRVVRLRDCYAWCVTHVDTEVTLGNTGLRTDKQQIITTAVQADPLDAPR